MTKMMLPTLVVLSALFCLGHGQEPADFVEIPSSINSFEAKYKYSPRIVTIRNQTHTAYLKHDFSSSVNKLQWELMSLPSDNSQRQVVKTCELPVPSDTISRIRIDRVVRLGNDKIVIVTDQQLNPNETWTHGVSRRSWIYNFIMDPFDCSTAKTFRVPTTDVQVLDLIPYYDCYDIIFWSFAPSRADQTKNPHRYNDQGQKVELDYSLEAEPTFYEKFQINTIIPFNASEGYYHTYKENNEIVLQRLDTRFKKVKEVRLSDTSVEVSTGQGHINYCSVSQNRFCKLLNADLEVQFTSDLSKLDFPIDGYEINVDGVRVINLPSNKGLVVLIEGFKFPSDYSLHYPYNFYLQWVGSDGSALKTWNIGNALLLSYLKHYAIVDSDKDFCHVIVGTQNHELTVYKRCLDIEP